jgi:hypothetical protein
MATITLRSSSGKWVYDTTIDDPLFCNILESIREANGDLPAEVTIPGALGEALDTSWDKVTLLSQWMLWEISRVEAYLDSNKTCGVPPAIVWRHEVEVLLSALNFPSTAEMFVMVDKQAPLVTRVDQMHHVLHYFRETKVSSCVHRSPQVGYIIRVLEDDGHIGSLIDPFIVNIVHQMHSGLIPRSSSGECWITIPILLEHLDWEALEAYLSHYKNDLDEKTRLLINTALGRGLDWTSTQNYTLSIVKSLGVGIGLRHDEHPMDYGRLGRLYSHMLRYIPDDMDPGKMGLDPILGTLSDDCTIGGVRVDSIVGWVNYGVITYYRWYLDRTQTSDPQSQKCINIEQERDVVRIPSSDFKWIVELLSDTVGIYAIRRILSSLRSYLQRNASHQPVAIGNLVTHITMTQEQRQTLYINRAKSFCNLLEESIKSHNGEDEEFRTLLLGQLPRVLQLRTYYH